MPAQIQESLVTQNIDSENRRAKSTEFSYLLERKAFRMMRKYYKESYEAWLQDPEYKKKLAFMTKSDLDKVLIKYISGEFGAIVQIIRDNSSKRGCSLCKYDIL